ncbi:S1 family peptidase [Methylobacterium brachiatum]|uniref:S1 family peptidase n=1 Tax=Methylobacterium brachiatum TaxID=269660 RepID=UPI00244ABCEC|nr:serine protease [Methylobacterium brachiatum]MDH2311410.1 serine protease [Methylobacterium brachiatum]
MSRLAKTSAFAIVALALSPIAAMSQNDLIRVPVSAPVDTDAAGRGGDAALQSVVRIICRNEGSSGTGFLHRSGKIVTAAHVIANCAQPSVVGANGVELFGKVEARDDDLDLALLGTAFPVGSNAIPISPGSDFQIGTQVTTWGFPGGYSGGQPLLSAGYLSGVQGFRRRSGTGVIKQWVVNAAFNSGNSGGPLIHIETGTVIGVVSSKLAPISADTQQILAILEQQQSGLTYTQTLSSGQTITVTEGKLIGRVLDELRRQVQLVVGYAATADDLRAFLSSHGVEP